MKEKKQSFAGGALILLVSGILVKGIGALFKIPLAGTVGDAAMGYFSSAYSVYAMLFLISTTGLPAAVSRLVAAARAGGDAAKVRRIFRAALTSFLGAGLLFSLALFFFADAIAAVPREPELAQCLRILSPLIFFVCISACMRGYFQGHGNMIPTAVSQVIEALGNLCLGLTFGVRAKAAGAPPAKIAAAVLTGIAAGAFCSALYLSVACARFIRKSGGPPAPGGLKETMKELFAVAVPITVSGAVMSFCGVADSMLAVRRMKEAAAVDLSSVKGAIETLIAAAAPTNAALAIYGAYSAKAMTLFSLTPTLITPFAVSLLPAVGAAHARGDRESVRREALFALKIALIIALPASLGLTVLSGPIVRLLFPVDETLAVTRAGVAVTSHTLVPALLSLLAPAIPLAAFVAVAGAVLQGTGHEKKSIVSTLCGVGVKCLSVFFLAGDSRIGAAALPVSTLLCYAVMTLFHARFLSRDAKLTFSVSGLFGKPFFAAALCAASAVGAFRLLSPPLGERRAVILSILGAAAVYTAALFLTGAVTREERARLFSGKKKSRRKATA